MKKETRQTIIRWFWVIAGSCLLVLFVVGISPRASSEVTGVVERLYSVPSDMGPDLQIQVRLSSGRLVNAGFPTIDRTGKTFRPGRGVVLLEQRMWIGGARYKFLRYRE